MIHLGVNIDHVATLRQVRQTVEPEPLAAALLAELGGADGITVHLREDRRHIQERDVRLLRQSIAGSLNLELAVDEAVLRFAEDLRPQRACLVPEKRQELTTEGGLAVRADDSRLREVIGRLQAIGSQVSLFIEADPATIELAQAYGADAVELHTGTWADAWLAAASGDRAAASRRDAELRRLEDAAQRCAELGLALHVGHGITYRNVGDLLALPLLRECNIGHSIIARAVLLGMREAVAEMRRRLDAA